MLILTRRIGESVVIDNGKIKVHVLDFKGGQVRLGVEAPREVSVNREEVQDKIDADQIAGKVFKRRV